MAELNLDADASPDQVVDRALKSDRATVPDAAMPTSGDPTLPVNEIIPSSFSSVASQPQADVSGDPDVKKALAGVSMPGWNAPTIPTDTVDRVVADLTQQGKDDVSAVLRDQLPRRTPSPMPTPEQTPGNIMRGAIGAFANPLMWLAIAGSTMTRRPAINALTAATGVLTGLNENDYKRAYLQTHKFRNSVKESAVQIANENAAYAAIFNDTKMSSADKIANLAGLAGSFDDKPMQQFLRQGNLGAAQQLWEGRKHIAEHTGRAASNWDKSQSQFASQADRTYAQAIADYKEPPPRQGGSKAEVERNRKTMELVRQLNPDYSPLEYEKKKSGEKAGATAQARREVKSQEEIEKIPPALRNQVRDFYPNLDLGKELGGIKTDAARHLQSAIDSTANLEEIANYTVAHPGALGYLADLQRRLNVDALRGMQLTPENKAKVDAAVDRQIDNAAGGRNIPDSASAKVLAKMLTTQAFNDAAMFGARGGTIYLDRAFREIYQQASSPDAFFNILAARYRNADLEMSNYHMGMNSRTDIDKKQFWNRGPDAYVRDFLQAKDQQRGAGSNNFAPKNEEFTDPQTGQKWRSKGGPRREQSTWEKVD